MKFRLILAALAGTASFATAAVNLPYSNSFDSDDGNVIEGTDAQWSYTGGALQNVNSTNGNNSSATVQVSGRGATERFEMRTSFTVVDTGPAMSIGLMFLSVLPGTGTGSNYYFADVTQAGLPRLYSVTDNGSAASIAHTLGGSDIGALTVGETISMTLVGTYNELGRLSINFSVSDGTNTRTLTNNTPIATPFAGEYFGFRNRNNNADGYTINFNELAITVPEPASLALAGMGILALGLRRRR